MPDVVTFDETTRRIVEISAAGDNELTIVEIYSEWKTWALDQDNIGNPPAFRVVGGDPISDTQNLGSTFFLTNGWRIRPSEEDHKLTVVGNVFTDPAGDSVFVPTLGSFTVNTETRVSNLQDAALTLMEDAIRFASYAGGVTVDVASSNTGTQHPTGTKKQPVNNFVDALAIAVEQGFDTIFIVGNATLDNSQDFTGYRFVGQGPNLTTMTLDTNAIFVNCSFLSSTVTGTLDGDSTIRDCVVNNLTFVSGIIESCVLQGTVTLGGTSAAQFINCSSGVPGVSTPIIDMGGGADPDLTLRNYSGGVELQNHTNAAQVASLDINSGQVILDSTVTAAGIVVRGQAKVTDNSGGQADITDLIQPYQINEVHSATSTRHEIDFTGSDASGWQEVFYDYTGAELARFNLFDEAAVRINETVASFVARGGMVASRVKV